MIIGDKNKDGVIISVTEGYNYYSASNDNALKPVEMKRISSDKVMVPKTLKVYEPVTVANNKITVTVHPDGRIEVLPSISK